jgi:hypothetical protein
MTNPPPPASQPSPGPSTRGAPAAAPPVATRSPAAAPRSLGPLIAVVVLVILAGAGAAAWLLQRPTVMFTNRLMGPVRLTLNESTRTVAPGETIRAKVPRDMLTAQWELVRPLSANQTPMGEEVKGAWVVRAPRGTIERAAEGRTDTGDFFAPLITNASDRLLRIAVNAGLEGAKDCGCAVRPGAQDVFIGYYRLYRNSTVRATDPQGRTATFRDLGPAAEARGWRVGLRFANENLGVGK